MSIPAGACPTPCIISVDPLPVNQASPRDGPLSGLTNLDQYPLFREFRLSAAFTEFAKPVLVGICHLKASDGGPFAPPDDATEARLQLAHPDPNNSEAIEILAKVNAPFLACADLLASNDEFTPVIGARRFSHLDQFASAAGGVLREALGPVLQTLLPERAEAAVLGSCCLGGATTKFSPWAAVDPESGQEIFFFSSPDFGTAAFDPGGKSFFTDLPLSWLYTKDGSSYFSTAYPAVQVLDQNGNPQSDIDVTVSLLPADEGSTGTLSGTLTQSTSGGNEAAGGNTAVFDDLFISEPGNYRLRFTAGTLTVDSGIFTVNVFENPG